MFEFTKIKQGAILTKFARNQEVVIIPDMYDGEPVISIDDAVFFNDKDLKKVVLPKTLIKLNCSTFCGCSSLKSIEFPEGLEEIGRECFYDCTSLEELIFPKSLSRIHVQCFCGCESLQKVISLNKNIILGELVFDRVLSIEEVNVNLLYGLDFNLYLQVEFAEKLLMEGTYDEELIELFSVKNKLKFSLLYTNNSKLLAMVLTVIPTLTLYDINRYLEYHIEEKNTSITACLLDYMNKNYSKYDIETEKSRNNLIEIGLEKPNLIEFSRLWNYSINNGEVTISSYIGSKKYETIPNNLSDGSLIVKIIKETVDTSEIEDLLMTTYFLKNAVFCRLEELTIEAKIKTIENNIFYNNSDIKKIMLPDSITCIKAGAFKQCSSLQEFALPYNVSVIYPETFSGCTNLVRIDLHNNLKIISNNSFQNASNLQEVTIPASVILIEKEAFLGCTSLIKLNFLGEVPKLEENVFKNCPIEKVLK